MKIKPRNNLFTGWGGAIRVGGTATIRGGRGYTKRSLSVARPPKTRGWSLSTVGMSLATLSQKCFGYSGRDSSGKGGLPCL